MAIDGKVNNEYFNDNRSPNQLILGGTGSGKTFTSMLKLQFICNSTPPVMNSEGDMVCYNHWLFIKKDKESLTTIFETLQKFFKSDFQRIPVSKDKVVWTVRYINPINPNNAYLYDNSEIYTEIKITFNISKRVSIGSLASTEYSGIYLNELDLDDDINGWHQLSEICNRTGRYLDTTFIDPDYRNTDQSKAALDYTQTILLIGDLNLPNPDSWKSWIFKLSEMPSRYTGLEKELFNMDGKLKLYKQPFPMFYINDKLIRNQEAENISNLPEGWGTYDITRRIISFEKALRDWCGIYIATSKGSLVHKISDSHIKPIKVNKDAIIRIAIDYGKKQNGAIFAFIQGNRVNVFAEYSEQGEDTETFAKKLKFIIIQNGFNRVIIKADPSGANAQGIGATYTNHFIASKHLGDVQSAGISNQNVQGRINALDTLISATHNQEPVLRIDPSCEKLIKCLKYDYVFKKDGITPNKSGFSSELPDCLQYLSVDMNKAVLSDGSKIREMQKRGGAMPQKKINTSIFRPRL